jgi:NADPH:quinone reductase
MRVIVCPTLGPLEQVAVEERDQPEPGPGQVAVDVRAAGVNFVDGLICQGRYQLRPAVPFVPGGEIAGVVRAVGAGVDTVAEGDRVLALTGFGGFAEQVVLPVAAAYRLPDTLSFAQGASLVQSYCTAMIALARRCAVAPDEWVLVLGAGGGIGLAAIDVAVALGGRVIAAASTPGRLAAATAMGAEASVAYEGEDLKTRVRELSGGGVDVVVDPVGGRHSEPALRSLRDFGRLCVIGFASGEIPSVPLNQVLLKNRTVVGVEWGSWAMSHPAENAALLGDVLAMVADGRLHPPVPAERSLDEAGAVMGALLDRSISGKVVLVP